MSAISILYLLTSLLTETIFFLIPKTYTVNTPRDDKSVRVRFYRRIRGLNFYRFFPFLSWQNEKNKKKKNITDSSRSNFNLYRALINHGRFQSLFPVFFFSQAKCNSFLSPPRSLVLVSSHIRRLPSILRSLRSWKRARSVNQMEFPLVSSIWKISRIT